MIHIHDAVGCLSCPIPPILPVTAFVNDAGAAPVAQLVPSRLATPIAARIPFVARTVRDCAFPL